MSQCGGRNGYHVVRPPNLVSKGGIKGLYQKVVMSRCNVRVGG